LYNCGIRGIMYNWFQNYLQNRKQYTIVNNISSNIGYITCGVPQGSVLGPLLFLIYVNDIYNAITEHDLKLFADDTNLFLVEKSFEKLEFKANVCLDKLQVWFLANRLTLNIEKTCYT